MTPGELEAIRERSTGAQTMPAGHLHAHEDRRRLLAHVDALQAERDAARAEVERLKGLLREAHVGLTHGGGSCAACGAEPGCDIDCVVCRWSSETEAALSEREVRDV